MEESDRKGLFLAACEQFGGADILVNNAASWTTSMAAKMPEEDFRRVLEMNLTVPFLLSQKLICHLTESGNYCKCHCSGIHEDGHADEIF